MVIFNARAKHSNKNRSADKLCFLYMHWEKRSMLFLGWTFGDMLKGPSAMRVKYEATYLHVKKFLPYSLCSRNYNAGSRDTVGSVWRISNRKLFMFMI